MTGHQEARYPKVTQAAMLAQTAVAAEIAMLMIRYSFDLGNYSPEQWIDQWLQQYPDLWLHEAVVEALYQGRYKAVSVWQILDLWQRRGKPLRLRGLIGSLTLHRGRREALRPRGHRRGLKGPRL